LLEMQDGSAVRVGGLLTAVKTIRTKKGERMAFVTLEDLLGTTEVVVFPEVYSRSDELLAEDSPVLVQGQLQLDENTAKILAETVVDINRAAETWSAAVHFHFDGDQARKEDFLLLRDILSRHQGDCRCYLHILGSDQTDTVVELSDRFTVSACPDLSGDIAQNLKCCSVTTTCKPVTLDPRPSRNGYSKTRNGR
jgi:DNA polymerase-3 subunit alpha